MVHINIPQGKITVICKIIESINVSKLQLLKFNYSVLCLFCFISLFIREFSEMFSFWVHWLAYHYETINEVGHASKKRRNKPSKFPAGEHVIFDSWKNVDNYQTSLSSLQNPLNALSSVAVFLGKKSRSVICSRCKTKPFVLRETSEDISCNEHGLHCLYFPRGL